MVQFFVVKRGLSAGVASKAESELGTDQHQLVFSLSNNRPLDKSVLGQTAFGQMSPYHPPCEDSHIYISFPFYF